MIQALYTLTLFLSFLHEGVALTYTIKALEPIGNLCVLRLVGKPTHVTSLSFLGLCFLPCGIFLSQISSSNFTLLGLAFALFNVALTSVRSVLLKIYTYNPSISYFHISTCGLLMLMPATLVRQDFPLWEWMTSPNLLFGIVSFTGYNFASFFVLSKVDPVFHAACNVLKRSVTVVISLLVLPRGTLSSQQLVGIGITLIALAVYAFGRSIPSDNLKLSKRRMSFYGLTLVLALAATMGVNDWSSSSQLAMNIDVFKYTLSRPPTIQVPSDLYHSHIIHSVLTRFMVGQPDQTTLAKARLELFRTFCYPTMLHQTSQNYYWLVLVDSGLDESIIQEMESLLMSSSPALDNVYMVLTNNTAWVQDGTNKERKSASYGVSLHTIVTEYEQGNLLIVTGNKAHLSSALKWYNNRNKRDNLIIIETLLDADDGMHYEGIERIQNLAVKHTTKNLQQQFNYLTTTTESSLVRDWWILCGTDHIEWHNQDIYNLKSDEYKKEGITSGVVGIRVQPQECISAGYTRVGLVTKNTKDHVTKDKSKDIKVRLYDVPLIASANHYAAVRAYSKCTTEVVTHCYRRCFGDKPFSVRTRTITSDGMTHLDPSLISYSMKTASTPDTAFQTSQGEHVWRLLQQEFSIDRYKAYETSLFLFEQRRNILAENEKGRCIPGFPCNKSATDIHKLLKVAINDGSDRLLDTRIPAKKRLVLITAVFGVSPLPPYFRMFLRSIQASGVDGIVIGGDELELENTLPPNVRHIPMTWDGLHDLISHKLFGGTPLPGFQAASGYKVNDVKPLYGFLFREYIQEYEFWAHVDNDMIFGDVARFMNPLMDQFDVISSLGRGQANCGLRSPCKITHGPFTAYRNVPEITELFRLIEADLYETLNTSEAYAVDEWGGLRNRLGTDNDGRDYVRSMSHVIHKYRHSLPIRVSSSAPSACAYHSEHACDCVWTSSDGTSSHLAENGRDVVFCHFLKTKHIAAQLLLEMPKSDQEAILHATSIIWSKENGISIVDDGKGGGDKLDPKKNLSTKNRGNVASSLQIKAKGRKQLNDWELRQPTIIRLHETQSSSIKKRHQCIEAIRDRHNKVADLLKPSLSQAVNNGSSEFNHKVILFDPAYHANVGDHMLTLGEMVFLRGLGVHPMDEVLQCGPNYQKVVAHCDNLKWWNDPTMILPGLTHAGGNWGDLWPSHNKLRNQVIKKCVERNMLLISMPQSLYFENKDLERNDSMTIESALMTGEGNTQNANKSTNVYLLWREHYSLNEANRLYPHANNILMPDIAFQLGPYEAQPLIRSDPRSVDIVFFLRDDKESVDSTGRNPDIIRDMLTELAGAGGENNTFVIVDWNDRLKMFNSSNSLFTDTAIKMLSAGKVVICDRLHASILAYLSGIPFIFIDQLTGKISKTLSVALGVAEGCSDGSVGQFARAINMTQAITLALEFMKSGSFRPDAITTTNWMRYD